MTAASTTSSSQAVGCRFNGCYKLLSPHCEERSDEVIHASLAIVWIASRSLSSGGANVPTRWLAMTKSHYRLRQGNASGKSAKTCPALSLKIFRLTRRANHRYLLAPSHPMRGALRNVTNVRWDAVDARLAKDERRLSRTAKSCGPGAPVLALSFARSKLSGKLLWDDGGNKPVTGESSKETVKPSRRESRIASADLYARVRFLSYSLHTRPRVQRAPGFPCALFYRGGETNRKARAVHAARTRTHNPLAV